MAVLRAGRKAAESALAAAVASVRERWEPRSTARNPELIRRARSARRESPDWCRPIEEGELLLATTA